jgi:hypothetical protein
VRGPNAETPSSTSARGSTGVSVVVELPEEAGPLGEHIHLRDYDLYQAQTARYVVLPVVGAVIFALLIFVLWIPLGLGSLSDLAKVVAVLTPVLGGGISVGVVKLVDKLLTRHRALSN